MSHNLNEYKFHLCKKGEALKFRKNLTLRDFNMLPTP